jgi:hypothetical protein
MPEHGKKDGGGGAWTCARALDSVIGSPGTEMLATTGLLPEPDHAAPRAHLPAST